MLYRAHQQTWFYSEQEWRSLTLDENTALLVMKPLYLLQEEPFEGAPRQHFCMAVVKRLSVRRQFRTVYTFSSCCHCKHLEIV